MTLRSTLLPATLALTLAMPAARAADPAFTDETEAWREQRTRNLTASDGWLALVGRHPLPPGTHTLGSAPDNAIRLATGPARLGLITRTPDGRVTLALADGADARIDGTAARTAELGLADDAPTYVRFGTANFYVMPRGGDFFLRVRDTASPRRTGFAGLAWYPPDPAWRVEAAWVPFDPPRTVPILNVMGQTSPETVPGKAVFTHGGRTHELLPVTAGDRLFFIFTDETAGEETYEASRFLYADAPRDGRVVLDFNRAYNPPCAFSPFTTCPLPPRENHLPLRVTAGEKAYPGPK